MKSILFLILPLFFMGCSSSRTVTLTEEQAQNVSNAHAGVTAVGIALDAERIPEARDLAAGADGFLFAALANADGVPPPVATPEELLVDGVPVQYREHGVAAKAAPPAGHNAGFWAALAGGGVGLAMLGLKVAKNLPGIAGTIAGVMQFGLEHFAPARFQDKLAEGEVKAKLALGTAVQYGAKVEQLVTLIPGAADKLRDVKDTARSKALELGVYDVIKEELIRVRGTTS